MIGTVLVIAAAVVLIRTGVDHARRPAHLQDVLAAQGLWTRRTKAVIAGVLPALELAVGSIVLLAATDRLAGVAAGLALAPLALGFGVVVATLLAHRSAAPCGCGHDDALVHPAAMLRPGLLLAAAIVLLIGTPGPSLHTLAGPYVVMAVLAGGSTAILLELVVSIASAPRTLARP